MLWNWGRRRQEATKKGLTVESTLNGSGESLIDLLNDWKTEQVKAPHKLSLLYNQQLKVRKEMHQMSKKTSEDEPSGPGQNNLPPPGVGPYKDQSVYSENTKKYHQIIDCLDEYQDEVLNMMTDLSQRPALYSQPSAESVVTDNSMFSSPRKTSTPGSEFETPALISSLSVNKIPQKHPLQPLENPFTMEPESGETPPWAEKKTPRKSDLIVDLGIPRSLRGSVRKQRTTEENNDYNAVVARLYFAVRKNGRPILKSSPNIFSPTENVYLGEKLAPPVKIRQKNPKGLSLNDRELLKSELSSENDGLGEYSGLSSPLKASFARPVTPSRAEFKLPMNGHQYRTFQKPAKPQVQSPSKPQVQKPASRHPDQNQITPPANGFPLDRSPNHITSHHVNSITNESPDLLEESISALSSIKSQITSFDSPERKTPSQFKQEKTFSTATSIYIYNHNSEKIKQVHGEDKTKINRASSVYALEPVEDFKNIDMTAHPLPLIGNLLSGNLTDYNVSSNPYADDGNNSSNPYSILESFNPYAL